MNFRSLHPNRIAICVLMATLLNLLTCSGASAQAVVYTGPMTAYSADILAQASYLQAQGDLIVAGAKARKLHAEAAEHEMRNSVTWIHTYFERRRLNREYRASENPGYLEREEKRYAQYRRLVDNLPSSFLDGKAGDLTDDLNWMLRDILSRSSYTWFTPGHADSLLNFAENMPLNTSDIHHLRMSDGKNIGGKSLVFRADTAEMLETRWPLTWRDEEFAPARSKFEKARDIALADLKSAQKLSRSSEVSLMNAVDGLTDALNKAYPRERQAESPQTFMCYLTAKRYVQALAMSTYRLIETQDQATFDDSLRFQGKSLGELLQHMMSRGLEFAPPEPGDENTYRKLFISMRALYLRVVPEPKQKSGG